MHRATSCPHHRCHADHSPAPPCKRALRGWLEGGSCYRDQRVRWGRAVAKVPGAWVPFSVQLGGWEVAGRFRSGLRAHPCRQAFPDGRASWAERVLGNDPSVHRSWMWRVSPSFGPGCHPLSEGRVPVLWPPAQGPRCLRGVIAVGSEVQGGGLSSLMSESGGQVARNGPPPGGRVPLRPAELREAQHRVSSQRANSPSPSETLSVLHRKGKRPMNVLLSFVFGRSCCS